MRFVSALWSLLFVTSCATAQTIDDIPIVVPSNPLTGRTVNVELHGYDCVLYLAPPDNPVVITRNGNAITLLVQAFVSGDPAFCVYPSGSVDFALGSFLPGSYTVQVKVQYDTFLDGTVTQLLGELPFTVNAPDMAPALNAWGMVVLVVLLAALSSGSIRKPISAVGA